MSGIKAWDGAIFGLAVAVTLSVAGIAETARAQSSSPVDPTGSAAAQIELRYKLAENCTIDAVPPSRKKRDFGLWRRSTPPGYLLPKKEDAAVEQGGGAIIWRNPGEGPDGSNYVESLTELKSLHDKGLIDPQQYEATQVRILTDLDPAESGVEDGLLLLRQLWDQGLLSEGPYALKRQEMLDAL